MVRSPSESSAEQAVGVEDERVRIGQLEVHHPQHTGQRAALLVGAAAKPPHDAPHKKEINKGVPKHPEIDVNSKMPAHLRRVPFENMIYIADGPSDIPAFSLVNKNGGATFAIYPKGDLAAFRQVEQLRKDGRIHIYAEADYREGTTAYMWISNKIEEFAERIRQNEKKSITESISSVPVHLED